MDPDVKYRNIYAPSVVAMADGSYHVFWDGTPSGNDQIYYLKASGDFLSFTNRRIVIAHGTFQHVCNVSAGINGDGTFTLMCTAYPDEQGLNKPAAFRLKDAAATRPARSKDIVEEIEEYPPYRPGDMNGMNPILLEPDRVQLELGEATAGRVRVYAEDGVTLQYTSGRVTLEPGRAYAVGR